MEEDKKAVVKKALMEVKNLPTLPGIVFKLTKMAEDPDATTEQMGKVISQDYVLAAKLLKLVNSAFYGFPQRISSINSAIILLGFSVIKSLIISASIFELMEKQDVELWEHSLGCAVVSNILATRLGVSDPEEISTAGLIHDIGKVAIKMELPEIHLEIAEIVQQRRISVREAEMEVMGLDHAEAGGWLAKSWNLPAKLVEPITCHHDPRKAKQEHLASAIIHASDIFIRAMGYGHGPDIWVPKLSKVAWETLKINEDALTGLIDEIEEKIWEVKGFSLDVISEMAEEA